MRLNSAFKGLNVDFNDHKEFVGQLNMYHEGSCLPVSKPHHVQWNLLSPNLRFITKVSTCLDPSRFRLSFTHGCISTPLRCNDL